MSNIDKITVNQQLFTELTSEEGAVIVGGATLRIDKIQAVKAGADFWDGDDIYIKVNGERLGGVFGFTAGDTRTVGVSKNFTESWAHIRLFDEDNGIFDWNDDAVGSFSVSSHPTNGQRKVTVSGSGSEYDVYYRVS